MNEDMKRSRMDEPDLPLPARRGWLKIVIDGVLFVLAVLYIISLIGGAVK